MYGAENYSGTKFLKQVLDVNSTTNTAMVHAETGRYPLSNYVNLCIIKFWFKILNSDVHKLIHIVYHHLFFLHQTHWVSVHFAQNSVVVFFVIMSKLL